MSEKHYPYIGGGFDRIIFDGDGSVWVPEAENVKLLKELEAEHVLAETLGHYHEDVKAENEKLRKLVQGFLSEHADYLGDGNYCIEDLDLLHAMRHNQAYFRHEAKKLGIEEVDE